MSDKKIVSAPIDEIVNAILTEFKQQDVVMAVWADQGAIHNQLESNTSFGTDALRAALGGFVVDEDEKDKLLERASWLIGHPATNISGSVDLACDSWLKDYDKFVEITSKKGGEDEA